MEISLEICKIINDWLNNKTFNNVVSKIKNEINEEKIEKMPIKEKLEEDIGKNKNNYENSFLEWLKK